MGHSAVFKWAMVLGQKYVRIHSSKHFITTAWEHIDCVQQQDSYRITYRNKFAT